MKSLTSELMKPWLLLALLSPKEGAKRVKVEGIAHQAEVGLIGEFRMQEVAQGILSLYLIQSKE